MTDHTSRIIRARLTVTCLCGEEVSVWHHDRGPALCTNCRRYWSFDPRLTWEHEYQQNPIGAIRELVRALWLARRKASGESGIDLTELNAIIEWCGAESVVHAVVEEWESRWLEMVEPEGLDG